MKEYDVLVIGSGPSGQKAAIQAAKAGRRVAVCEQLREAGGACVQYGTIPSKALRERALDQVRTLERLQALDIVDPRASVGVAGLVGEMSEVVKAHDRYMSEQLERNGVELVHGRASFESDHEVSVRYLNGHREHYRADYIVIASGSKPRQLDRVPVDHEFIFDSDSILSLAYLPDSMLVLGGGVVACEYASFLALLGVKVTLVDRQPWPLGFLDRDLTERFLESFERKGGTFVGGAEVVDAAFDGVSQVVTRFADGSRITSEKVLCALGRVAQLDGLRVERAGVRVNDRQLVEVNAAGQTSVPHIYAVGDVIGAPSLASAAMEEGRRAACDFLGLPSGDSSDWIPTGIYAVPELASVGLTENEAQARYGDVVTGFAHFREIARGQIANATDGMLKLVVSMDRILRGVHIVGAQATDLIHIGQMGLIYGATVDSFVENIFNFPTYAEAYRVAALAAALRLDGAQRNSAVP